MGATGCRRTKYYSVTNLYPTSTVGLELLIAREAIHIAFGAAPRKPVRVHREHRSELAVHGLDRRCRRAGAWVHPGRRRGMSQRNQRLDHEIASKGRLCRVRADLPISTEVLQVSAELMAPPSHHFFDEPRNDHMAEGSAGSLRRSWRRARP
jgi:hypothetical protein